MNRIFSQRNAKYLSVSALLIALLLMVSVFAFIVAPTSAALPSRAKPVGASATSTETLTATDTPISTSTFTSTHTSYPTSTPAITPTACQIQFSDVPEGSTYYDYVRCLACRGMVSGYPDGTFRPGEYVTRGQLSKIVVNASGLTGSIPSDQQTFEDVPTNSTFWLYIEQLAVRGYVNGYPCSGQGEPCVPPANRRYFRPGTITTRAQTAGIIDRVAGFGSPCIPGRNFEDVPVDDSFWCSIQRLYERNIVVGYPCGGGGEPCVPPGNLPYFRPGLPVTRGQSGKMTIQTFLPDCNTP